jgi:glyoxylase-like metal-dependent hydrolase (beta-lactamase superfamily II)
MTTAALPQDLVFFERGWLSSNTTLLLGPEVVVIDSGYHLHAPQLLALINQTLGLEPPQSQAQDLQDLQGLAHAAPQTLINTHLHSDHCGGNDYLQHQWPTLQTWVPESVFKATLAWDPDQLTFQSTGQTAPRFTPHGALSHGQELLINGRTWQIHNVAGHQADGFLMFAPKDRLLLSADALWEDGFGVLFDQLVSDDGFESQDQTLQLIERLNPAWVLPGHGAPFRGLEPALSRAKSRLDYWRSAPREHAKHAAHVMIKFHLMAHQQLSWSTLLQWAQAVPLLKKTHQIMESTEEFDDWLKDRVDSLALKKACEVVNEWVINC